MKKEEDENEEGGVDEATPPPPMDGDILEEILSHVPLIDLLPASHVSRSWNRAATSSIRTSNRPLEPWLVIHTQNSRSLYHSTTHAYDPQSHIWIEINQPPLNYDSVLRSSQSNLIYTLSPSKLSFSLDPLHLSWHHAAGPIVCRTDPVVALVARRLIVAGGAADFEDDPLAVEIYDLDSRAAAERRSMPAVFKGSASSTWLSAAADNRRMVLTKKSSGVTHTFDPETNAWDGPYDLRPDPSIFCSVIASAANNRLILIGLTGDAEDLKGVKVFEVNSGSFVCEQIGEMPEKLVEKLKGESFEISSINVCSAEDVIYVYNPSEIGEVFVCEIDEGGIRWGSVVVAGDGGRRFRDRVVVTCSKVGMVDACKALSLEKRRFPASSF